MALGDGIRRNIAAVSQEERDLFIDAIKQLNHVSYPGARSDFPAGGVSYWFKQDEIHQSSHVHGCPAFLPWHRDLCHRFEALLRSIHPELSLHYWDWNEDPSHMPDGQGGFVNLFDSSFMGNADPTVNPIGVFPFGGAVGEPLKSAGFYDPTAVNYRDNNSPVNLVRPNPNDPTTFSYPAGYNPADPPQTLSRAKQPGAPPVGVGSWPKDSDLINAPTWEAFRDLMYGDELPPPHNKPTGAHGAAHSYIGGNLNDPHLSFRDPFVFLMHANIDRLWAMWQRDPNHPERLDPAHVYNTEENTTGSGDVEIGDPQWGILSPLEPWAGYSAQTAQTGIVGHIWPVRPWFAPENEQNLPGNNKNSQDITVVIPPSYDTALHSSYIIANQNTFSTSQAAVNLIFPQAIYVIYEGFQPREVGTPTASNPSFTFSISGVAINSISAANPQVFLEDPSGAPDVPQRISILYDIVFSNTSAFPTAQGAEKAVAMLVELSYTVGGTTVTATDKTSASLLLVNQPSPFMIDIDPTIPPPGPTNPYWLSVDTRVFQVKGPGGGHPAGSVLGVTQGDMDADSHAPFAFITNILSQLQTSPSQFDNTAIFPTDETTSELELSQKAGPGNHQRVYNYVIARVRYIAPAAVPATNVSVFFRVFSTAVSGLDYDATSGARGNYRRTSNNNAASVPLLGIENDARGHPETASIPFFAVPRVRAASGDSGATPIASMTAQPVDSPNIQTINGIGSETVAFFGAWLDVNLAPGDPNYHELPLNPNPTNPDGGPFTVPTQPIQQLMLNTHHCLVAEIFFWPTGTTGDPIPSDASPASSDHLAQRNLVLVRSGNPGFPATHTVQTTFVVKPSIRYLDQSPVAAQAIAASTEAQAGQQTRVGRRVVQTAVIKTHHRGPDELIVRWNNVPRESEVAIYMPEIAADEILALAALRQHPPVLEKIDAHTLRCRLADVTYIPLPMNRRGTIAGLLSVVLPQGIRAGQVFKFSVEQYSGLTLTTVGAFQMTIPVRRDAELLPEEIKKLSVMRYIQQGIPSNSRWFSIFVRYIDQIAARVRGLGCDPGTVNPSPAGDGGQQPAPHHEEHERRVAFDGKIAGLIFDRFGDFAGFVLDTEDGEREFTSRERDMEELAERAWSERLPIRVWVERDEPQRLLSVIIRQPPATFRAP